MEIGENLGASFEYAKEALVGKWVKWILLAIIGIIPIVNFILFGYAIRVLRGIKPAPELGEYVQLFIDGLMYFIIAFVWMIPVFIVSMIVGFISGSFAGMIIGLLIMLIVALLCGLFAYIGIVRFARMEKFGEAFAFGAINEKIEAIGWVKYIIALIVVGIVIGVISFILMLIPIIGWLLMLVLMPFFVIFQARYICNLYDSA
ncbi:MAG: DUF4013 domain-containing protein [Methanomicrobiales archaeon]|nr:DUF4013 domain-containing protein [Methanomicrobiales archaeon]